MDMLVEMRGLERPNALLTNGLASQPGHTRTITEHSIEIIEPPTCCFGEKQIPKSMVQPVWDDPFHSECTQLVYRVCGSTLSSGDFCHSIRLEISSTPRFSFCLAFVAWTTCDHVLDNSCKSFVERPSLCLIPHPLAGWNYMLRNICGTITISMRPVRVLRLNIAPL